MTNIAVLGSANMDLVATTPRLPGPGETVLGTHFSTVPGGKGANQAIAAARAGGACAFLGAVGDDAFGAELRSTLAAAGVDVSALRTVPGPSGVALIAVDERAENTIVVVPGANGTVTALSEVDRRAIEGADVLLCQLETPLDAVLSAAGHARGAGVRVLLNAAPARVLPSELLALVDLLVVNEHEAAIVAGSPEVEALLALVPQVVLTLGAAGAVYASRTGEPIRVAAPKVDAVDTTAAGDAFTGAFAVAWGEGRPEGEALRWACAAGAVCATRPGASSALPTRAEIHALFEAGS
jgi:ribokinase